MYRKVQYFMGTSIVSCQFPLKQIHWYSLHTMITNHTIHTYHTVILWWFMFVTPATLVPHREKPGWKKKLRYAPLQVVQLDRCVMVSWIQNMIYHVFYIFACILCMYLSTYAYGLYTILCICVFIHVCMYVCMYVYIYIYVVRVCRYVW